MIGGVPVAEAFQVKLGELPMPPASGAGEIGTGALGLKTVVKLKKVRRYCTRQRHGWRCGPTAPHQKPLKG